MALRVVVELPAEHYESGLHLPARKPPLFNDGETKQGGGRKKWVEFGGLWVEFGGLGGGVWRIGGGV